MRKQPHPRRAQYQHGQHIDRDGGPEQLPQGFHPACQQAAGHRGTGHIGRVHRGFGQYVRARDALGEQRHPHHQHHTRHQAQGTELPAQHEAHEHQRGRVEHRVGDPERQRRAYRHILPTQPGSHRCRAATAHHARQGEQAATQGRAQPGLAEQAQQPVARYQHLNQRAEDHRQQRRLPDGQEVHLGIRQRCRQRCVLVIVQDRGADAVAVGGNKRLGVVGRPFHVVQANGGHQQERQRFAPLRPATGGGSRQARHGATPGRWAFRQE